MSKPYQTRFTRISICPEGEPIFSEMVTHVEIDDEAGGEYVVIRQQSGHVDADKQAVAIVPKEWPLVREAVNRLMADIRAWEGKPHEL